MIWLLRLDFAGRTWYLASRSCSPERDEVELPHHGTLTVNAFAEGIEIGGGWTGPSTADVEFHLEEDGWSYVLEGHRLEPSRGEISLWAEGTTYAQRVVLLRGLFKCAEIPLPGEPFRATLTERVIDLSTPWPNPDDVVTATAWPNAPADPDTFSVIGTVYPMPLGLLGPYVTDDGTAGKTSTTQMIIVDDTAAAEVGCVAGAPVAATEVRIWNQDLRTTADFTVSTTTDGDGIRRATVDLSAAPGPWLFDGSATYYVTNWNEGGLISTRGPGAAKGLGDVLVYLLERRYDQDGPERIDYGSWAALASTLNAWTLGIIPESGDPLDIITQSILPLCPGLYIMGGPTGIRPVFCADTPGPRCPLLTVGAEIDLSDDAPGYVDIEVVNTVSTTFAYSQGSSKYRAVATIGRNESPDSAASVTHYGTRSLTLDGLATYDRGTAALAATETIRFRWCKPIYIVYEASSEVALGLVLGGRYRITDESRQLTERLLWLLCRETDDGISWGLTFFGYW
jgi:hypothetical protein